MTVAPAATAGPRTGRTLAGLAVAVTALHALHASGALGRVSDTVDTWLFLGAIGLAAASCVVRALSGRDARAAWTFVAGALVLWLLSDVYWHFAISGREGAPSPSPADAGWLVFYVLAYAGVALLTRAQVPRFTSVAWLDGVIGGMAAASLASALLVDRVVAGASGSFWAVATNVAFPVADLVLLVFVVGGTAAAGWRLERAWLLAAASLAVLLVADSLFLADVAAATYVKGTLQDSLWPLAFTLMAVAAWQPARTKPRPLRSDGRVSLFLTLGFIVLALSLLLVGALGEAPMTPVAAVTATLTLVAACVRTGKAFLDVARLAETRQQALTDELTGLPNRRMLHRDASRALEAASQSSGCLALLLLDLDGFKEVNDTLGHGAGDGLLREIGPRLADALEPGQVLARLGGDEFAVLLPGCDAAEGKAVAHHLRRALDWPFSVESLKLMVDASIGVAAFPEHGRTIEDLIRRADVAMYQAKEARSGAEIYAAWLDRHSRDHLQLVSELHGALDRGEIALHYQPQALAQTGEVVGAEALVRWRHPSRGLLTPADFLFAVEQTGLMRTLTLHVLDEALRRVTAWRAAGRPLRVSVNLAVVNTLDQDLPADVGRLLDRHGAAPEWLVLEVTETVVMADAGRAAAVLGQLRAMGVDVALDDFGTGHSSLSWLETLPVDELKIDRAFVRDLTSRPVAAAIVRATIDLATALQLRTVAEGAEDDETWRALQAAGCEAVQGFVLSPALPADEFTAWLAARELVTSAPSP